MGYIREKYDLYNSIEVHEHMDCRHYEEGERCEKRKRTPEEMARANQKRKEAKARRLVWANFEEGDYVRTLTFDPEKRPKDMAEAKLIQSKFLRILAREYGKRFYKLFWIANIERTPRNAWHIHLICNRIEGGGDIIKDNWRQYGGVFDQELRDLKGCDIGAYITKSPASTDQKDHKVVETRYSHSRNLIIPEPKKTEISGWSMRDKPRVPKGYYLDKNTLVEGVGATGYRYRTYIMRRLVPKKRNREIEQNEGKNLRRRRRPPAAQKGKVGGIHHRGRRT